MKHYRVEPYSGEWHALHLGVPTASHFHRIITPAQWNYSRQARPYAFQLAAEVLLRERSSGGLEGVEAMERGKALEPHAVGMYEFAERVATSPCGFLTTDDGRIGCTPDRLITEKNAALEVKCPSNWVHLQYLIDGFEASYLPQVFGQMLVGEFDYVDRYSYHPMMPPRLARTYRDGPRIEALNMALLQFLNERDAIIEKARAEGLFEKHVGPVETAVDQAYQEFNRMTPEDGNEL